MAYDSIQAYLTDHLAGATAGVEVVETATKEYKNREVGEFFSALAIEIKKDYGTLEDVMQTMGVEESGLKSTLAEMGAAIAKPKFKGMGDDNRDLGPFNSLEALSVGVHGKACMWKALITVADSYDGLKEFDLDALKARAEDQLDRIEAKRLELAPKALTPTEVGANA